jgi:transcriptional regulator with XRE-family HTH domain
MAEKGVTQEVVAHVLGIEQQSVSKRLTGLVPFKAHQLFQIADLLGITVSVMLDDMTQQPAPPDGGASRARGDSNPRHSAYYDADRDRIVKARSRFVTPATVAA